MSACMVPGCDRPRERDALCGPHSREQIRDRGLGGTGKIEQNGAGNVATLQDYRAQQAEPEPSEVEFSCPDCAQKFSRPNGLTRHRNQTHGNGLAKAAPKAKAINSRTREKSTVESEVQVVALDLTPDELDVIDAVAFIESSTREHVLTTLVTKYLSEQPAEIVKLARLRASKR